MSSSAASANYVQPTTPDLVVDVARFAATIDIGRLDPAVICLIHDGHDRAVLARQTVWPERLFSLIAGFVEAGESFESCVVREVAEEIGLSVTDVTYLASQPTTSTRAKS